MRKLLASLFLIITLGTTQGAYAGPHEDGYTAFKRGDYATALSLWRPLAAQGNASAQFNLGLMYEDGRGVVQDHKEAVKWYRLAAAQGLAQAQYKLGGMYDNGQGVLQDHKEAERLYRLAAAQGNASAQFELAGMYKEGQGVPQNYVLAHMWYSVSASLMSRQDETFAINNRDEIVVKMTPAQIEQAQEMARKCQASNFKDCETTLGIAQGANAGPLSTVMSAAKEETESAFRKCMNSVDLGAFKNNQWTACYEAELKRQDHQLNAVYQKIQKAATPELKQALIKGQRAWLAYRDAWCSYEELMPMAPGGSVNKAACLVDVTIAQILRLKNSRTD